MHPGAAVVRTLAVCRPVAGADMSAFATHVPDEVRAVRALLDSGALLEAYTIGRPGAVLILDGDAAQARTVLATLPLVAAGLLDLELLELTPMPA